LFLDTIGEIYKKNKPGAISYTYKVTILLSVVALLFGGLIYIFLRPSEYLFFGLPKFFGLDKWINFNNQFSNSLYQILPDWFIYSLPNGLWAFVYSLLIAGIWWNTKSFIRYFWLGTIPILILGWEIFQLIKILPGTYSMGDIIFGILGIISGIYTGIKLTKRYNHEKESV
jgi:hypothetical protein